MTNITKVLSQISRAHLHYILLLCFAYFILRVSCYIVHPICKFGALTCICQKLITYKYLRF